MGSNRPEARRARLDVIAETHRCLAHASGVGRHNPQEFQIRGPALRSQEGPITEIP
jgi:hypothetical protein